jgi:hypothetical protein
VPAHASTSGAPVQAPAERGNRAMETTARRAPYEASHRAPEDQSVLEDVRSIMLEALQALLARVGHMHLGLNVRLAVMALHHSANVEAAKAFHVVR